MSAIKALSKQEITENLSGDLKNWIYDDTSISREFKFKSFIEAFSFMTAVALEAEKMDHHPDWSNVYNQVRVHLNTHSAGGITELDFRLAGSIDRIYANFPKAGA